MSSSALAELWSRLQVGRDAAATTTTSTQQRKITLLVCGCPSIDKQQVIRQLTSSFRRTAEAMLDKFEEEQLQTATGSERARLLRAREHRQQQQQRKHTDPASSSAIKPLKTSSFGLGFDLVSITLPTTQSDALPSATQRQVVEVELYALDMPEMLSIAVPMLSIRNSSDVVERGQQEGLVQVLLCIDERATAASVQAQVQLWRDALLSQREETKSIVAAATTTWWWEAINDAIGKEFGARHLEVFDTESADIHLRSRERQFPFPTTILRTPHCYTPGFVRFEAPNVVSDDALHSFAAHVQSQQKRASFQEQHRQLLRRVAMEASCAFLDLAPASSAGVVASSSSSSLSSACDSLAALCLLVPLLTKTGNYDGWLRQQLKDSLLLGVSSSPPSVSILPHGADTVGRLSLASARASDIAAFVAELTAVTGAATTVNTATANKQSAVVVGAGGAQDEDEANSERYVVPPELLHGAVLKRIAEEQQRAQRGQDHSAVSKLHNQQADDHDGPAWDEF